MVNQTGIVTRQGFLHALNVWLSVGEDHTYEQKGFIMKDILNQNIIHTITFAKLRTLHPIIIKSTCLKNWYHYTRNRNEKLPLEIGNEIS